MNWGHRLKEIVIRNWREKIISLVLAFLFWFMIKAQDRYPASHAPQSVKMVPQTFPPPPQLNPTVQPSPEVPEKLVPAIPSSSAVEAPPPEPKPEAEAGAGAVKSKGL